MYITEIEIENIRSIRRLEWKISEEQAPGWHVILGDNGSGKTSFVRAIAYNLVGIDRITHLWSHGGDWLRQGTNQGYIELSVSPDVHYDSPILSQLKCYFEGYPGNITRSVAVANTEMDDLAKYLWDTPLIKGWFSASFGPFRRFTGSDTRYDKIMQGDYFLARHITALAEGVALTETLNWLQELRFKQLEKKPEGALLDYVREFINQPGFLPHGVQLVEVNSDEVVFVDGDDNRVPIQELSDGFRSILSLTMELVRQLARCYGQDKIFTPDFQQVNVPGVVVIDEVDAHLHPTWQRQIGPWFRKLFPNLQFIVTTHSPLVCQEATTAFKLPTPGTDEIGHMITGADFDRLRYGNVMEAYSSEAFGMGQTRSDAGERKMERLAELNIKELEEGLTAKERQEQERLRSALPTTAHDLPQPTVA